MYLYYGYRERLAAMLLNVWDTLAMGERHYSVQICISRNYSVQIYTYMHIPYISI